MDYGVNSEKMSNSRLPYASDGMGDRKALYPFGKAYFEGGATNAAAFVQLSDDVDINEDDEEDEETLA